MDLSRLEMVRECVWTVLEGPGERRAPVILFGTDSLLRAMDDKVLEQILNTARLPGLVGSAMTMPDAHWGYGFPIGGVAAFDPDRGGVISAGGVGFDISCGIRTLKTDLAIERASEGFDRLADELYSVIPAGVGEESKIRLSSGELERAMDGGAAWAVLQGYGDKTDLDFVEERGCIAGARPECVSDRAKERQKTEMGTLGSGNHYLEVQVVDRIDDSEAARAYGLFKGQILVSIHCGSRGFGHQIGTDYLLSFARAASAHGIVLPDRDLACAPIRSEIGQEYIGAMNSAINIALANRQILSQLVRDVFSRIYPGVSLDTLYDVSHNTCKAEVHKVDGVRKTVWVHRKGATRALGPGHPSVPEAYRAAGQPVFIGGSMGTGSAILAGTAASEEISFSSASHGAGRAMSRHEALRHWNGRTVRRELEEAGIRVRSRSIRGIAEEAPGAYKDIEAVANATEKAGLARRVAYLKPKVCVKG